MAKEKINAFRGELESLLNKHSKENGSDTPDFILANYLIACMDNFDLTVRRRTEWFGGTTGRLFTTGGAIVSGPKK